MAYYIMNRLAIQYFKHDLRRENTKYCIGRYVRYTIKAVPHKVFSRFNPSNVETHVKHECDRKTWEEPGCIHGSFEKDLYSSQLRYYRHHGVSG